MNVEELGSKNSMILLNATVTSKRQTSVKRIYWFHTQIHTYYSVSSELIVYSHRHIPFLILYYSKIRTRKIHVHFQVLIHSHIMDALSLKTNNSLH